MSLSHPNTPVSQQDLHDFYNKIKPYMGSYPSAIVSKFKKSDLYSTDERVVGQWTDGKPLYQLTYHISERLTNSPYAWGDITGINVVNMWGNCKLYKSSASAYAGRMNFDGEFASTGSSDDQTISLKTNYQETQMVIYFQGDFHLEDTYVTLQYTKTTDSAISIGEETDYSTTEKVVGTWIDGSPIWQRTVLVQNVANASTYNISSWNIDEYVDIKGFTTDTVNGNHVPLTYSSGDSSADGKFSYWYNTTTVGFHVTNMNNQDVTLTIQYTKSTD